MAMTLEAAMDGGEQWCDAWSPGVSGCSQLDAGCSMASFCGCPPVLEYPWPGRVKYSREKCLVLRSL